MIDWLGRPEQRLRSWRQFRLYLEKLSPSDAVAEVCKEWSMAPFVTKYLRPYDNVDWPDPWTLLNDGKFCNLAKALGIFYTLTLCIHFKDAPVELKIYSDLSNEHYDLVFIDTLVLNYVHGIPVEIVQLDPNLVLQYSYTKDDLHTDDFR